MEKNSLTQSEVALMEIFWREERALTSVEIVQLKGDGKWNDSYIHSMLRALIKKNFLTICGVEQYGAQYARKFIPAISREEYVARFALSAGINKESIADVTVAMVRALSKEDEVTDILKSLISELIEKEE